VVWSFVTLAWSRLRSRHEAGGDAFLVRLIGRTVTMSWVWMVAAMYLGKRRRWKIFLAIVTGVVGVLLPAVAVPGAYGAAQPPNDDFANSIAVTGTSGSVTGTLNGATLEPGEPVPDSGTATVWWTWTAPADGTWRFAVEAFDVQLTLWRGTAVDQLIAADTSYCAAGAAGGPYARVVAGQQYHVRAQGWSGSVTVSWTPAGRPANDDFAAAIPISGYNGETPASTCLATAESGEPRPALASGPTVWFRWQAADRVRVVFSTGTNDAVVYVWRGSSVDTLTAVGQRLSTESVEVVPDKGAVYHLQVATASDIDFYAGLPTSLVWKHYVASNDFNYNARGIPPAEVSPWDRSGVLWTDNIDATLQAGEPALITGQTGATLWWSVQPLEVPATLTLDTSQSTPDTVVGVFAGAPTDSLTRLAVADGGGSTQGAAKLSVALTTGRTYTVIVDGESGQTGAIRLSWLLRHPRPPNDNFAAGYAIGGSGGRPNPGPGRPPGSPASPTTPACGPPAPCGGTGRLRRPAEWSSPGRLTDPSSHTGAAR
jgi:hypothetical protein